MTDASVQVKAIWEPATPEPVDPATLSFEERVELWNLAIESILPQLRHMNGFKPLDQRMAEQISTVLIPRNGTLYSVTAPTRIEYTEGIYGDTHVVMLCEVPMSILIPNIRAWLCITRDGRIVGIESYYAEGVKGRRRSNDPTLNGLVTKISLTLIADYQAFMLKESPYSLGRLLVSLMESMQSTINAKLSQVINLREQHSKLNQALDRLKRID